MIRMHRSSGKDFAGVLKDLQQLRSQEPVGRETWVWTCEGSPKELQVTEKELKQVPWLVGVRGACKEMSLKT